MLAALAVAHYLQARTGWTIKTPRVDPAVLADRDHHRRQPPDRRATPPSPPEMATVSTTSPIGPASGSILRALNRAQPICNSDLGDGWPVRHLRWSRSRQLKAASLEQQPARRQLEYKRASAM